MDFQPLKYIFQSSGKPDAPTLILLHGTGGDETDLLPLATHFGNNQNVLSLRGNVSEHGMPRFFKRLGMGVFDEEDLRFRTLELANFIRILAERERFSLSGMIALGYSNGANIAGSLLMLDPDLLAGAILLRPMQPYKTPEPFNTKKQQPVLITNGQYDPTIDLADTLQYAALLQTAGFDITRVTVPGGHQLSQEDLDAAVKWYQHFFA